MFNASRLPGDLSPKAMIARMIRVNHAGEYGAKRIYQGQAQFLKEPAAKEAVAEMAAQEQAHLDYFTAEMQERHVRPTAFLPLWHVLGFGVGAITAALGTRAAMACTIAVEEAIDEHYTAQLDLLHTTLQDPSLQEAITQFREEEREHKEIAMTAEGEKALGYPLLSAIIKQGSKLAIRLSTHW